MAKRVRTIITTEVCWCGSTHAELVECTSCEGHRYGPDDAGQYETAEALEYPCDVCDCHGRRYVCQGCGDHFCSVTYYKRS